MKENLQEIDYWKSHYERWKTSGLGQIEYCSSNGISISKFKHWRTRLHKGGHITLSKQPKAAMRFKPVLGTPGALAPASAKEAESLNTEIELRLPGDIQLLLRRYTS